MLTAAATFLVSLASGFLAIALGFALQRRYALAFLPAYFLYLASSVVYGLFNWTGIVFVGQALEPASAATLKAGIVFATLAFPFLILRVVFLCDFVRRWLGRTGGVVLWAGYFVLGLALAIPYGAAVVRYFGGDENMDLIVVDWVGTAALAVQVLAHLFGLAARPAKAVPPGLVAVLRRFAAISLIFFSAYIALAFWGLRLSGAKDILPSFYFLILLPPLFYLRHVLAKTTPDLGAFPDVEAKLSRMAETFGWSPREAEIARLLVGGKSNKEIAAALFLSPHTVKNATSRIYEKAGVRGRSQLLSRIL